MKLNLIHPEMNICSYGDCTTAYCVIVIGGDIYCKRHAIDALCGAELASLRARVGEQQTQAKIGVLNELLQEIDETVYVETWGYIEQKRDELSVALAKGAK